MLLKGLPFSVKRTVSVTSVVRKICCAANRAQDSATEFLCRRAKGNIAGECWLPQRRFKRLPTYSASIRRPYGVAARSTGFDASRKIDRLRTTYNPYF